MSFPLISIRALRNVCTVPPTAAQLKISQAFWSAMDDDTDYKPALLEPYFSYYTEQCKAYHSYLRKGFHSLTHPDLVELAKDLKRGRTRQDVRANVQLKMNAAGSSEFPGIPNVCADHLLNLVGRLLLMTDIGRLPAGGNWTGRAFRDWSGGSIHNFTANAFPIQQSCRHESIRLDLDFNARNLYFIGGLKIELTNNLLDHLEVVYFEGETTVMIFHHVCFLQNQQHEYFPPGFIAETLQTLALLFPQGKWFKKTKAWYTKELRPVTPDADPAILACGTVTMTEFSDYRYWHDRLVRLKLLFDQAKPRTLRQWWNDRRDRQWHALWAAVALGILFGLVQSIEGAVQIYMAYHPDGGK